MLTLASTQVWVQDQDEALDFWINRVGFEVKEDVTVAALGNFRWLTVGPKTDTGTAVVLMAIPGPPVMDEQTKSLVERLMSQGFATGLFFTTDDAHAAYASLVANGVEVTGEPTEQPYGIDFGFRDPSGNSYRVSQRIPLG